MSVRGAWKLPLVVCAAGLLLGCAHRSQRDLSRASKQLSKSVSRSDATEVRKSVAPGARATVDTNAMLSGPAKKQWSKALAKPQAVRPEALFFLDPQMPVRAIEGPDGWRFVEDPTDVFARDTPRHALRTLVVASREQRWEIVMALAPKRYRMGLSVEELAQAWTDGEHAKVLTAARDQVAAHLADPIQADADEATLEIAPGHVARLEREGDHWVIVDFLPDHD